MKNLIKTSLFFIIVCLTISCGSDDEQETPCEEQTWYLDSDGDGFGDESNSISSCIQESNYVSNSDDCDDSNSEINPVAVEIENDGLDNNCDGLSLTIDPPTDFEITMSNVTLTSALAEWTESTTEGDNGVLYDIYLNEELQVESLDVLLYSFANLLHSTVYDVKVVAISEFGETESFSQFETQNPANGTILLNNLRYSAPEDKGLVIFNYNDNLDLISKEYVGNIENTHDINYTGTGKISRERIAFLLDGKYEISSNSVQYSFGNNNLLTGATIRNSYEFGSSISDHYFYSFTPTSYERESFYDPIGQPFYYSGTTQYDTDGRLIYHSIVQSGTNDDETVRFEYANGNLTKISVEGFAELDILYDNNQSFHTYSYVARDSYPTSEIAGLYFLGSLGLSDIPMIFGNKNANNPIEYRRNGVLEKSFTYEYNSLGYPEKMTINETGAYIEFNYAIY